LSSRDQSSWEPGILRGHVRDAWMSWSLGRRSAIAIGAAGVVVFAVTQSGQAGMMVDLGHAGPQNLDASGAMYFKSSDCTGYLFMEPFLI